MKQNITKSHQTLMMLALPYSPLCRQTGRQRDSKDHGQTERQTDRHSDRQGEMGRKSDFEKQIKIIIQPIKYSQFKSIFPKHLQMMKLRGHFEINFN